MCHICSAHPCLRVSLYMSGLISVLPSQDPLVSGLATMAPDWTKLNFPNTRGVTSHCSCPPCCYLHCSCPPIPLCPQSPAPTCAPLCRLRWLLALIPSLPHMPAPVGMTGWYTGHSFHWVQHPLLWQQDTQTMRSSSWATGTVTLIIPTLMYPMTAFFIFPPGYIGPYPIRAQHESICRSPVLEPMGLVNMWGCHLDPNGFKRQITWPVDDYLQVTCVYLHMPKAP